MSNNRTENAAKAIYEVFRSDGKDLGMSAWPDWNDAPDDVRWLVLDAAQAAGVCPIGPTPEGSWPINNHVMDAGVQAYTANYGKHGIRETLMAVWNAMHRAQQEHPEVFRRVPRK